MSVEHPRSSSQLLTPPTLEDPSPASVPAAGSGTIDELSSYVVVPMSLYWGSTHWQNRACRLYLDNEEAVRSFVQAPGQPGDFPKILVIKSPPASSPSHPGGSLPSVSLPHGGRANIYHLHDHENFFELQVWRRHHDGDIPSLLADALPGTPPDSILLEKIQLKQGILKFGNVLYIADNVKFPSATRSNKELLLDDSQPKRRKIFDIPDEINPISPWTEFETELRTTKRSGEEFLQHLNRVFERSADMEANSVPIQRHEFVGWLDALLASGYTVTRSEAALAILGTAVTHRWLYCAVSHGKVKQYLQPLPNKDKSGTVDHNFFMIRISKSRMPFFALNATYYNPKTESSASFSGHILFRIIANNKIRVFLETADDSAASESEDLNGVADYIMSKTGWKPVPEPFNPARVRLPDAAPN